MEQWRRDIKVVAEGAQDVQGGPKPAPEAGDENQEHRYLDQDEDAGDSDAQALGDATEDQAARAGAVDEDADEAAEAVEQETASGAERPEAMRVETEPVSEEAREEKRREQESSGGKVAEGDDSGSELDEDKEAGDEASAEDATEETAFEPDAVLSDRVDDLSLADVVRRTAAGCHGVLHRETARPPPPLSLVLKRASPLSPPPSFLQAPQSLAEVRAMASATGGDARPGAQGRTRAFCCRGFFACLRPRTSVNTLARSSPPNSPPQSLSHFFFQRSYVCSLFFFFPLLVLSPRAIFLFLGFSFAVQLVCVAALGVIAFVTSPCPCPSAPFFPFGLSPSSPRFVFCSRPRRGYCDRPGSLEGERGCGCWARRRAHRAAAAHP